MLIKLKQSIQWKFTCIFAVLVLFILLAILLANTFLLERFYASEKIKILENAYTELDEMIVNSEKDGREAFSLFPKNYDSLFPETDTEATRYIRTLSETYNVSVVILDTSTDISFSSSVDSQRQERKLAEYIFGNRSNSTGKIVESFDNYFVEHNEDRSGNDYLESWGYFSDNKTAFIMSMSIASVREATGFFNRFLLTVGMIAMAVGSVIICFASRAITSPIQQLARLSEKMSELDFSARYEGDSEDELGILGKSMNILSERLESSIASLKTANNELQLDIENKTEVDRRRQEFVANVSHELKTPIALIQGYAEGLQDGLAEDKESRDYYCGVIVDEASKMNRMVRELMNVSAIEQGKDIPDFSLFNLSRVVQEVVSNSDILIRQQNAKVELDIPENLDVWADEFKIEEVITNYLNNALHHLEEPWQISIYTGLPPQGGGRSTGHFPGFSSYVSAKRSPGQGASMPSEASSLIGKNGIIALHVMNTGKHIPEEELPKIWEKFYKSDKARTRSYGGSGLGLSIVKAIANAHHQSCGVRNTRTGVDFWFTLEYRLDGSARRP